MYWFLSFFLGFLSFLFWGLFWFFLEKTGWFPFWAVIPLFALSLLLDFVTLRRRADFYYRKGLLNYALIRLQWHFFWLLSTEKKLKTLGDIAWVLMDLGHTHQAGYLLSRPGDVADFAPPLFNAALARYLLSVKTQPHLPLLLTESALAQGKEARAWLCRGIALLQCDQPKAALRSLEESRTIAIQKGDYILNGTCYYYLGVAWRMLGKVNYSKDQLLKAEVLLSPLPLGLQARKTL